MGAAHPPRRRLRELLAGPPQVVGQTAQPSSPTVGHENVHRENPGGYRGPPLPPAVHPGVREPGTVLAFPHVPRRPGAAPEVQQVEHNRAFGQAGDFGGGETNAERNMPQKPPGVRSPAPYHGTGRRGSGVNYDHHRRIEAA